MLTIYQILNPNPNPNLTLSLKLISELLPIKDLGTIDNILGWKIIRNRAPRTLKISQSHYINDKIVSFGLSNAKPYNSPSEDYSGILPTYEGELLADESANSSAVGSLGYASNSTRPDITFATSQLGWHNSSPVERHWNSTRRVLRDLRIIVSPITLALIPVNVNQNIWQRFIQIQITHQIFLPADQ